MIRAMRLGSVLDQRVAAKRSRTRCAGIAVALASVLACAVSVISGTAQSTAAEAIAPTVKLEQNSLGEILVDGSGHTIYLFTRDRHDRDTCVKVSGCLEAWPALTTKHKPIAGSGVNARLLGTIELHGGVKQVTYAGHPLYTYAFDFLGRATYNIGSDEYGGKWEAVSVAGHGVS
jgi:predicted lipoprotein with Yx(FWY)xxD motif